jgi:hypothetical protein
VKPLKAATELGEFREMVAERAYAKAEKRGFAPGNELEDWLEAEQEIKNQCFYWLLDEQ